MIFSVSSLYVYAAELYIKESGQYKICIADNEDMLTENQERQLTEYMQPVTEYGTAIFVTSSSYDKKAEAKKWYRQYAGNGSGIIFLIDMGCRQIYIFSDGEINKKIGRNYASGITDNVYRYASNGDYYGCAKEAFSQIYQALDKGNVFIPMKVINGFFLSLMISMVLMYLFTSETRKHYLTDTIGTYEENSKKYAFAKKE